MSRAGQRAEAEGSEDPEPVTNVRPPVRSTARMVGPEHLRGVFTTVHRGRSFDEIVLQIEHAITRGHLQIGDRLPNERELVELFGVSRPTIREAMRVLESSGLVEIRRGATGGVFVAEPKPDNLVRALLALIRFRKATERDLAEFRLSFEGQVAAWAAERASDEQASSAMALARRYAELATDPGADWATLVEIDMSFHEVLAEASGNQVAMAVMLTIHQALREASLSNEMRSLRVREASDLIAVAQALRARDPDSARRRMTEHVHWNWAWSLESEGQTASPGVGSAEDKPT